MFIGTATEKRPCGAAPGTRGSKSSQTTSSSTSAARRSHATTQEGTSRSIYSEEKKIVVALGWSLGLVKWDEKNQAF
jgi:hypothetical protein